MESNFFCTTIGEQVTLQRGFDITKKQQKPGCIPVVSSGGISSFHNEAKVVAPGVVLGRKGSLGTVFYLGVDFWPHDTSLWVKDFKGNNPKFVYYFFKYMANALKKMDVGAANPALNRNHVHLLTTQWPERSIQDGVDKIGTVIDNKIDINNQTNQTLEKMAQTLFKSWFVDFDPVFDNLLAKVDFDLTKLPNDFPEVLLKRAEKRLLALNANKSSDVGASTLGTTGKTNKADLQADKQAQSANIHQHFPSEFEFNEQLGWIPKGWLTKALYDVAEYVNGAAYKKFEPNTDGIGLPIIKIAELKSGVTDKTGFSTVQMPEKYKIYDNDILFSWSGNPDTSIDTFEWSLGKAWLNQHIFKVVPNKEIERNFVYCLLKNMKPIFSDIARDKQTTGLGHVTVKDLKRLQIIMPSEGVIDVFNNEVAHLLKKSYIQVKQTQQLTKLRDTLLPKLISGELQIPDVVNAHCDGK